MELILHLLSVSFSVISTQFVSVVKTSAMVSTQTGPMLVSQ